MNLIGIQSRSLEDARLLKIIEDGLDPMVHQIRGGDVPSRHAALDPLSGSVPHTGTKFKRPGGRSELANSKDTVASLCRVPSQASINLMGAR